MLNAAYLPRGLAVRLLLICCVALFVFAVGGRHQRRRKSDPEVLSMFASAAARIRATSIWCTSSARRCAAGACAAGAAPAGVRALHVEAHLISKGIQLPKAIVPPQGKNGWSGGPRTYSAGLSWYVDTAEVALERTCMCVKPATATCRRYVLLQQYLLQRRKPTRQVTLWWEEIAVWFSLFRPEQLCTLPLSIQPPYVLPTTL